MVVTKCTERSSIGNAMSNSYDIYHFTWKEHMQYNLEGVAATFVLGGLFYKSIVGILMVSPLIYFYQKKRKVKQVKERKWKMNLEFRDGILALSAALEAGYSAEHALEEACKDLQQLYSENAMIIKEFSYMVNQLRMNITVEKTLEDFGERTGIDDIQNFSDVFYTAKRTGGDLLNIIKNSSNIISDKVEVQREIITLITAKRLEANIMKVIPILILIYLSISSPGFLDPLYHNTIGFIVMTAFLLIYLGAYILIDKIVEIRV